VFEESLLSVIHVFQQLFLWPHLTLRENILLPVRGRVGAEERLEELMALFDMHHFIDRYPNETSGGQRQRAALARAVVLESQYVLLDEITSALDVEQTAKVLQCLEAMKQRGIGILLITHLLNFAKRAADHVVFLDGGEVIASGTADILDNPTHPRMQAFLSDANLAS
jgi:ABC-type polar amino acid transport system ATPase subunit